MSEITSSIIQATEVIVDSAVSNLALDKTVAAEVVEVVNLDTGEYKVRYESAILAAFSTDLTKMYDIGDNVYVKIPQNDLSNKKTIEGKINRNDLSIIQQNSLQNSVVAVGPDWGSLYLANGKPITNSILQICAGITQDDADYNDKYIDKFVLNQENINTAVNTNLTEYLKDHTTIRVGAKFRTRLVGAHNEAREKYGLRFIFSSADEKVEIPYVLTFDNFNGDPYRFNTPAEQYAIIDVSNVAIKGLKRVELYQEGFKPDRYPSINNDGALNNDFNVFASDITINFVDIIDYTKLPYYLSIKTPKGTDVNTQGDDGIVLQGFFLCQGKDITLDAKSEYTWFVEDFDVRDSNDEGFDKLAGPGWKRITETLTSSDLRTAKNELRVFAIDNAEELLDNTLKLNTQRKYKLIAVYNGITIVESEVLVYHTKVSDFVLRQNPENKKLIEFGYYNENNEWITPDNSYAARWFYTTTDGRFVELTEGATPHNVSIENLSEYLFLTIYAKIIYKNELNEVFDLCTIYLDVLNQTADNEQEPPYYFKGPTVFTYDANGDITLEDSEKERILSIEFPSAPDMKIAWYIGDQLISSKENGHDNAAQIDNSMIQYCWVDNNSKLHFTIKPKYNERYINNIVHIQASFADTVFDIYRELIFMKDGDQGTNGTSYVCVIRPVDESGNRIVTPKGLHYNKSDKIWGEDLTLGAFVYLNGEHKIEDVKYEWTTSIISYNKNITETIEGEEVIEKQYQRLFNFQSAINLSSPSIISEDKLPEGANPETYNYKNLIAPGDKSTLTINGNEQTIKEDNNNKLFVTLKVTVDGITLYYHYPIIISVYTGEDNDILDYTNLDIQIPQHIKYTSSGLNASFANLNLNLTYVEKNDTIEEEIDIIKYTVSKDEDKLKIIESEKFNYIYCAADTIPTTPTGSYYSYPEAAAQEGEWHRTQEKDKDNYFSYVDMSIGEWAEPKSIDDTDFGLNTIQNSEENILYRLQPATKFNFSNGIGVLYCYDDTTTEGATSDNYLIYPVMMYLNTFGNEAINDWDGTNIVIDDEDHIILAPQIGAGKKDPSTNTFTGVVMGQDSVQEKVGLYGYQDGITTFGLKEDGSAFFGPVNGSQILINGESATIQGSVPSDKNGITMELNLVGHDKTDKAIKIGDVFSIDYSGIGKLGNWTISDGAIYYEKDNIITTSLGSDGYVKLTNGVICGVAPTTNESGEVTKVDTMTINLTNNSTKQIVNINGQEIEIDVPGDAINVGDKFKVDYAGNITMTGAITWGEGTSPAQALYSVAATDKPEGPYNSFDTISTDNQWHKVVTTRDIFASYTYDGGATWTERVQVRGIDGDPGEATSTLYARTKIAKPTKTYEEYDDNSTTAWHKKFDVKNDQYASYTQTGPTDWTEPIRINNEAKQVTLPTYIKRTYIDDTTIQSCTITGGQFYATGLGRVINNENENEIEYQPAYYITDGGTFYESTGEFIANDPIGWICYDENGAGTETENKNRVFFTTTENTVLKLKSGGDMSLEATDKLLYLQALQIHLAGQVILSHGKGYGSTLPSGTQPVGRLFFKI